MREPLIAETIRPPRAHKLLHGAVLGGLVVGFLGLVVGPRVIEDHFGHSKDELAARHVKTLALEAFPRWAVANPAQQCPRKLSELVAYIENKSVKDPWGQPYLFTCGAHRIYVASYGPDRKPNTVDDIWSHQ